MKETLEDAHRYPGLPYVELRDTLPRARRPALRPHCGRAMGSPAMLRYIAGSLVKTKSEAIFPEPSFAADLPGRGRM
ncbi:hypothetical protein [Streptomyces sp. NPDC046862]|uniref:hypothetical protein n=1 Tax=Streptomyces sp. NPDC046862 TaxID=3154603 RepID=UPI0034563532